MKFRKSVPSDNFSGLIPNGTLIEGNVSFVGTMKVEGIIKGDVTGVSARPQTSKVNDCLVIGFTGIVTGKSVNCFDIEVSGTIFAEEIICDGLFHIKQGARIESSKIFYRQLKIDQGANIHKCQLINLDQGESKADAEPTQAA
jgi:cytoskeletal protein CcmA (bactofilin family)